MSGFQVTYLELNRPDRLAEVKHELEHNSRSKASCREPGRAARFAELRRALGPPLVLRLTGFATRYNQVADLERSGLTEYVAGCFGSGFSVPLLRDHDFGARLGHGVALAEDPLGLRMSYAIHADRSGLAAVEAFLGGYRALSIGSCIGDFRHSSRGGRNVRRVTRASVAEVSLVRVAAFEGTTASLHPVGGRTLKEAIAYLAEAASSGM